MLHPTSQEKSTSSSSTEATTYPTNPSNSSKLNPLSLPFSNSLINSIEESVLLATALVHTKGSDGSRHLTRVLLDQGAQASFISESLVQRLRLARQPAIISVRSVGDSRTRPTRGLVQLKVYSRIHPQATFWESISSVQSIVGLQSPVDHELLNLLRRFVVQEDIPLSVNDNSVAEEECEQLFTSTFQRSHDGRYIVRLPLKDRSINLGNSRSAAYRALVHMERRFRRDPELAKKYSNVINEYAELGDMELVSNPEDLQHDKGYFLPHHCVIKENSSSTKLRVVFNASQRTDKGVPLNELLHSGPKLQTELADVILRWRMYSVFFTADIEKMFRRIWIHPVDQTFKKILWRESHDQEVRTYYLKTVTFGFTSLPYLAIRTLLQLAEDEGDNYPLASQILRKEIYVDDVLSGADDVSLARAKCRQLDLLLQAGAFTLKKWVSNVGEVLEGVPTDHREDATYLLLNQDPSFRALGISWQPSSDFLRFQIDPLSERSRITKRTVFSEIARIFGPLGWLAPVIVKAKMFMQSLWARTVLWDDELSMDYCELHGFGDASERAIGAVIYLRVTSPSNLTRVTLVMAKTKVARLKETSIPRLELCAAVLLIHLWSDSQNNLDWIRGPPLRWKTYISNRFSENQRVLPEAAWHHVPGADTPADCASGGLTPIRLEHHLLWWQGPVWLARPELLKHFERPPCHPTTTYLKLALQKLTGHVQKKTFPKDIIKVQRQLPVSKSSLLLKLLPFLDSNGLLRLGGRLTYAALDYEERCPYILPKDSPLTTLIVRNGHQFMLHGGPQLTLSYLRRRYWILSCRTAVKSVLSRCVICTKHRANPCSQVICPLPSFRVNPPVRPFAAAGLDYAGPIWMRTTKGRGHKAYKGYIAIFVCCATRAVHLEVVSDYSAEGFIAAYKRFSARRGVSHTLYSDNGTNFVGADREFREIFSEASAESDKIVRHITDNHTTWKFNPPAAPHFGGLWEAVVKSVKHHLRRW
ncbi:uncharacterized protein LOC117181300 [Belonocnema kinseyi]|uniref:uncharacterized protein LOC117181300 n=1 Tax=Belonocnema kinseyi TaxID=2817044 RepID=UPI00143CF402|nr:uncharacterized protein LOC117181300 [Belonocnema kinseyi]